MVKTAIVLLLCFSACTPAVAMDTCEMYANLSFTIMRNRQAGVALKDTFAIVKGHRALELISIEAYKTPRYSSSEYQHRAAEDFRDQQHLVCIEAQR